MGNKALKIILSSVMVSLSVPILSISSVSNKEMIYDSSVTVQEEVIADDNNKISHEDYDINEEIEIAIENMDKELEEINGIENLRDWFVAYKCLVEDYSYILDPPETIYDYYTNKELELLFRVVQSEVGDEYTFEQKANIASIIFNRIEHEDFPNKMLDILSKDQFQPIRDERYNDVEVSNETILACEYSFMFGDTTNGCLFFDSNGKLKYEFVYSDCAHNFYK